MRKVKRSQVIPILSLLLLLFSFPLQALGAVEDIIPNSEGSIYVTDPNHYLSESTKQELINQSNLVRDRTSAQIGFVLIDSLQGYTVQEFAVAALRAYGLGEEGKDNGVLVVLVPGEKKGERDAWIEVGYGLEGILPDGKVGRLMNEYLLPSLEDENIDQAVLDISKALSDEIIQEYDGQGTGNGEQSEEPLSLFEKIAVGFIGIIVIIVVIFLWKIFTRNMSREEKVDLLFLIFHVIINLISRGGGNNGGGRNDKGGGGSSGGGGAGRKW